MKKLFLIILGLFCAILLSAQTDKTKCKIELKDGSVLIGYVAQQADGSYVVESESGDIFYYTANEIRRITELVKENVRIESSKSDKRSVKGKEKGYLGMVNIGVGVAGVTYYGYGEYGDYTESYTEPVLSAHFINAYRFSPFFALGLGVGVEYDDDRAISIPVYANTLFEFSRKRVSPYLSLGFGVQYITGYEEIAPFTDLSFGLNFIKKSGNTFGVGLSFGYCSSMESESIPLQLKVTFGF